MVSIPSPTSPNQRSPPHSPSIPCSPTGLSQYRPHPSSRHNIAKGRYITSNDPRGYIPVYEYPLNGQWIMMDIDDGYILWTGIWKALGNSKADIVKMLDSHPDLSTVIRRVRGGYLKIQGTWMPYENALDLARRVAWPIREDLVPLFGPSFPASCLSPGQPGYGQVITPRNRRRPRRQPATTAANREPKAHRPSPPRYSASHTSPPPTTEYPRSWGPEDNSSPFAPPLPPGVSHLPQAEVSPSHRSTHSLSLQNRYTPYPRHPSRSSLPMISIPSNGEMPSDPDNLRLAPILVSHRSPVSLYALPSLAAMEDLRGVGSSDSRAVLRRLKADDGEYPVYQQHFPPPAPSVQEILGKCQRDFLLSN